MTPQQFIKEVEEDLKGVSAQGYTTERNSHKVLDGELLMDIEEAMLKAFRSQLSRLLEEVERSMPDEIDDSEDWGDSENHRIMGHNSYRQSMLTTLKEWKEWVEGKEGVHEN